MNTILAIGSPFGADRIGWQIAEALQKLGVPQVHSARHPIDILPYLQSGPDCIVIDALQAGRSYGEVLVIEPEALCNDYCQDAHGLSLYDVLELARLSGQLPDHLLIVGIEIGQQLSRTFTDQQANSMARDLCQRLNSLVHQ